MKFAHNAKSVKQQLKENVITILTQIIRYF